jgi:hypothetical protein
LVLALRQTLTNSGAATGAMEHSEQLAVQVVSVHALSTKRVLMPSSDAILAGLTAIANEWRSLAVAWHIFTAAVLAAGFCGWRPSNRVAAYVLSAPLLSVSAASWVWGNPFNGTLFAALFLLLLALASRLSKGPVHFGAPILMIPGALFVAFGWGYPHFLETDRWTTYAYAAPLGLLPCPTLSVVIGGTLIFGLLGSATWPISLAAAGLVYGAIGVFVLGVPLDYVLLAGALVLMGAMRTFTFRQGPVSGLRSGNRKG